MILGFISLNIQDLRKKKRSHIYLKKIKIARVDFKTHNSMHVINQIFEIFFERWMNLSVREFRHKFAYKIT